MLKDIISSNECACAKGTEKDLHILLCFARTNRRHAKFTTPIATKGAIANHVSP